VSSTVQALVVTSERVPLSVPLAGLGERAIAAFIDFLIVLLLGIAVLFVYTFFGRGDLQQDVSRATTTMAVLAVVTVLSGIVLYDVVGDLVFDGRTPGKRLVRLRVVDRRGRPPDLATSLLRNLLRLVDMIPVGYGVGLVVLFFSGTRRIGDFVAGTVVISERARGPRLLEQLAAAARGVDVAGVSGVTLDDDDVLKAIDAVRRSEGLEAGAAERLCARVLTGLAPRLGRLASPTPPAATPATLPARARLAAAVLAQARGDAGMAARLRRLHDAEVALVAALDHRSDAFAIDAAARVASSELLAATRRGVPARFLEALSLALLDVERRRRPPSPPLWPALQQLIGHEIPAAVWGERGGIARAAVVVFGSGVLGFALAFLEPSLGRALIGDALTELVEQGARWTDQIERDGRYLQATLSIVFNNSLVGLRVFALGVLGGVATVLGLVSNGLSLGATFGTAVRLDTHQTLARFIVAHGPVELSMICVAGAAGFCLGRAVLSPGARTRVQALREEGRRGFLLVAFATIGFVVIGTVEGFVSPGAHFSAASNAVVGVALWLLFFGWARLGRTATVTSR
jgi:uncharacterized RDD family membrane protein YckC/uncharacterized membrane protein SpoIIM required for sporulation